MLRAASPPNFIPFGSPSIHAVIIREDGVWRIREMVLDHVAMSAFEAELERNGNQVYPEHAERFMLPTGAVRLEAPTLDAFCAAIETMAWPNDW